MSKLEGLNFYGFASDQSPKRAKQYTGPNFKQLCAVSYWSRGIAKKYNMALVFMDVQKLRGFMKLHYH